MNRTAAALGAVLLLSGCSTSQLTGVQLAAAVAITDVISATKTACNYTPDNVLVQQLIAAGIQVFLAAAPGFAPADAVAKAICVAVAPLASGPGASKTPGYVRADDGKLRRVRGHF